MSIDLEQFHQVFFEESLENLDVVEQALVEVDVDSDIDSEVINTIFRAAHSIKGGSGTFGFTEVTEFTHLMETLLDEVRDGVRPLTQELVDALLKSCDCLRHWFDCLQAKQDLSDEQSKPLVVIFENMLNKNSALASTEVNVSKTTAGTDHVPLHHWQITFIPHSEILLSGNEPIRLFRQLEQMGEYKVIADISGVEDIDQLTVDECFISWNIELVTTTGKEDIVEIFEWVIDECTLTITDNIPTVEANNVPEIGREMIAEKSGAIVEEAKKPKTKIEIAQKTKTIAASSAASSIRVGIDKVDNLINLVGELVITQSMLSELGNNFDMSKIERLSSGLDQLLQNTKELQENVMRIRMLPISFAFNRFPRMIRDLSVKIGKKVDLQINGEHTELDKTVMEKIGDPLVHLVRNAIDHGIESVEERVAANKPEMGVIKLDAYHQGGNIVIEIVDDGKGIDANIIGQKAIEKGIVDDVSKLSDGQIYDLIFEPGFSTAAEISDISGRGVGMDVVRRNITSLGGRIDIESEVGKGSIFRVHLPLTLAILDGQLVRVGSEVFIIPLISIVESLQIKAELVNKVSGNMILYRLREDNVPIIPIYKEFNIEADNTELDSALLVVVEGDGRKVGLLVDDLLAQQQVVIKSLESNYKRIEGISGATILGDGSVALILDILGLITQTTPKKSHSNRSMKAA
ncbi:chemotaxis protein CheA [Candidatus Endobugula sertula]|uniref:Chemotaxis protein CheA n=1 Tax=Candidatus Endobugula sertula TaxID=62101 RepID=A0A1D2QQX4_9GAMM|nr:chemotaxis protein CheA [Candidatus Endobugula sertula]